MSVAFLSNMPRVILLLMLVIMSPPFILQAKNLAAADLKLMIKTLCHNSETPETCTTCVMSSEHAEEADSVGITTILVNSISDKGKTQAANWTKLASVTSDAKLKPLIRRCAKDYGHTAEENLISAKKSLQDYKYDNAEISVVKARDLDLNCHHKLRRYHHKVPVPSQVFYDMKMYEDLSDSACRIIEKLYV